MAHQREIISQLHKDFIPAAAPAGIEPQRRLEKCPESRAIGAKTWLIALQRILQNNPPAKFLGATATPVHSEANIQEIFNELFDGQSFWAYLDHAEETRGIERSVSVVVTQLEQAILKGELTPLGRFFAIDPGSFRDDGKSIFVSNGNSSFIDPVYYEDLTKEDGGLHQWFIRTSKLSEDEWPEDLKIRAALREHKNREAQLAE